MTQKLIEFNVRRHDLAVLYGLAEDSAKMLAKFGARSFTNRAEEAHYFLDAIAYHTETVIMQHDQVMVSDNALGRQAENLGQWILEGWRPDVLATAFEFDALLVCTRAFFDRFVQALATPLNRQLPKSITDTIKKHSHLCQEPLLSVLVEAWNSWGIDAKNYRDCFLHYWTLHQELAVIHPVNVRQLLIPDNPQVNSPKQFTYDRKIALVDFAKNLNKRCHELANKLFEHIFEGLIDEEFGQTARVVYWDRIPDTKSITIKGNYKIDLTPGFASDKLVRGLRFKRELVFENGEARLIWNVPDGWKNSQDADGRALSENTTYFAQTELPIALKKIADLASHEQAENSAN